MRLDEVCVGRERQNGRLAPAAELDDCGRPVLGSERSRPGRRLDARRVGLPEHGREAERESALDGVERSRRVHAVQSKVPGAVDRDADRVDPHVGPRTPGAPGHAVLDSGSLAAEPDAALARRPREYEPRGELLADRVDAVHSMRRLEVGECEHRVGEDDADRVSEVPAEAEHARVGELPVLCRALLR